ncbi:hypothetical protein L1887_58180 [Cichorium endivia]|nr:hypothetical protein L1887_58180 [Cichorium endivia]
MEPTEAYIQPPTLAICEDSALLHWAADRVRPDKCAKSAPKQHSHTTQASSEKFQKKPPTCQPKKSPTQHGLHIRFADFRLFFSEWQPGPSLDAVTRHGGTLAASIPRCDSSTLCTENVPAGRVRPKTAAPANASKLRRPTRLLRSR